MRPPLLRLLSIVVAACAIVMAVASPAHSVEYRWTPVGPNTWPAPGNWTPTRTVPDVTDRLVFDSGTSIQATGVPNETIAQLVVVNGTRIILNAASSGNVLTLAGDTGPDLEITGGSTLSLAGPNALLVNLGTGATGAIAGGLRAIGGGPRLQALDADAIAFSSGGFASSETGFTGNLFGTGAGASALNSVRFQAGSVYAQAAGANPFAAGQPSSVVIFEPGSLFRLDASISPSISGRTYANFEYNGPGSAIGSGTSACTIDSIVVNSGTLGLETNGMNGILNLRGSVRVRPGAQLNLGPISSGGVNYRLNGAVAQALIDSSGNSISNPGINIRPTVTLTIDNPAGIMSDGGVGTITVPGTLEFVQGIATLTLREALTGTTIGGSAATGWINGRITAYNLLPSNSTHTFPIGTATAYLPVDLTVHGMTDSISTGALVHSDVAFNPTYFLGSQLDTTKLVTQSWLVALLDTLAWTNFDAVMHFGPGDYGAGADPNSFVARKQSYRVGANTAADFQWRTAPTGSVTATSHQVVGVTRRIPSNTNFNFAIGEPTEVRISVLDAAIAEDVPALRTRDLPSLNVGNTVSMRVVLSEGATDPVAVDYQTSSGTATQGVDFGGTGGTISFAEGDTAFVIHVPITGDNDPENNETFTLTLSDAFRAVLDRDVATGTILDDDDVTPPSVSVLAPNGGETVLEGASVDLEWLATDNVVVNAVDLFLSRDDGATYEPIAAGLPNTGSFAWIVTAPLTPLARFKAVAADHRLQLGEDASDAVWAISDATGVEPVIPVAFAFDLASANPSRGTSRIRYALPRDQHVRLTIMDVRGRVVAVLKNGDEVAGLHEVAWEGRTGGGAAPAGIYFVSFRSEEWSAQRRIVRLR